MIFFLSPDKSLTLTQHVNADNGPPLVISETSCHSLVPNAIGWVNSVMSGLVRQVLVLLMILVPCQKCLNGHVSIRAGPWSNGRRLPGLINHIFFYIRCLAGCVFTWGRDSRSLNYGKKAGQGRQNHALLGNWYSCECYCGKYHLPRDCYRLHTRIHGNGAPWWQWAL